MYHAIYKFLQLKTLQIINSDLPVNIKEFNMMCKETRSLIKSKMPYFRYTPTLHTVMLILSILNNLVEN